MSRRPLLHGGTARWPRSSASTREFRRESPMHRGSLNIIGTGHRIAAQVTPEALACVKRADRLFYLVSDPVSEAWLGDLHPHAFSLRGCWFPERTSHENCDDMVRRIMSSLR